jgi:hypothetical protein
MALFRVTLVPDHDVLTSRDHLYPLDSRPRCPVETSPHRVGHRHLHQVLLDSELGTKDHAICVLCHDCADTAECGRADDQGV